MSAPDRHTLQLPSRYLEILLQLIRRHLPQADIWAYGSRVAGDCHAASDLDLVVRNRNCLTDPVPGLFDFKEALVESNLPIRVDVVDWARVPESFRREIERGYIVVWEGKEDG